MLSPGESNKIVVLTFAVSLTAAMLHNSLTIKTGSKDCKVASETCWLFIFSVR